MAKRITSSVTIGIAVIIGVTFLVAIISQPFVKMFEIPRRSLYPLFGQGGVIGLNVVFGSYIVTGGVGSFLAGFLLGRNNLKFNQQCTEAVVSGLLIILFGYACTLIRFEMFLIMPTIGVCSAVGGCWIGRIYDKHYRRVQAAGGLILLVLAITGIGIVMPLVKLPLGCPPGCDGIDLAGQDLTRLEFQNASLKGANFSGANLSEANLSGVDLRSADLSNSNLRHTDLRESNLSGVNFTNVITEETYFDGAIMPDGKIHQ